MSRAETKDMVRTGLDTNLTCGELEKGHSPDKNQPGGSGFNIQTSHTGRKQQMYLLSESWGTSLLPDELIQHAYVSLSLVCTRSIDDGDPTTVRATRRRNSQLARSTNLSNTRVWKVSTVTWVGRGTSGLHKISISSPKRPGKLNIHNQAYHNAPTHS